MVCDFSGEGSAILLLVEVSTRLMRTAFTSQLSAQFTLLSPGAANGLYTIGGIMLTLITPGLAAVGPLGDVDHVARRRRQ